MKPPDLEPDNICAVIVTFHPDERFEDLLAWARREAGGTVVVDNSTDPEARATVRERALAAGAELRAGPRNEGVAAALNRGFELAAARGFGWVLCLDQDTVVEGPMLEILIAAYERHAGSHPVGIVGSRGLRETVDGCGGAESVERTHVVTSGSLASTQVFREVGPFREDFFIDFVDIEWCLRLRARGYRVVQACRPTMRHAAGAPRRTRVLWRRVGASHHDAVRRYYITRNRVVVWREYRRRDPAFVRADVKLFLKETAKIPLVEEDRGRKLRNVARGIRDALRRRMGPFPSSYSDRG